MNIKKAPDVGNRGLKQKVRKNENKGNWKDFIFAYFFIIAYRINNCQILNKRS